MAAKQSGTLFLIPTPIGDNYKREFPDFNVAEIEKIRFFIVEELRTARRFLKSIGYPHPFTEEMFMVLNEHTTNVVVENYLAEAKKGNSIGLMSEAGMPCTADPGAIVVAQAHKIGIAVVPLVGASSMLLALSASGFNGQQFTFNGYLPIDKTAREHFIKELERKAHEHVTQLFIEAPYRNVQMFDSLCKILNPNTLMCIASGLYTSEMFIKTLSIKTWAKLGAPDFHKVPAVFLIGD